MSSRLEFEHKTILGATDETIKSFLKEAPRGSTLIISSDNSAEIETIIEFPRIRALTNTASKIEHQLIDKMSEKRKALSKRAISSPAVRTFRRALKPT